jgi:hypothetical protein
MVQAGLVIHSKAGNRQKSGKFSLRSNDLKRKMISKFLYPSMSLRITLTILVVSIALLSCWKYREPIVDPGTPVNPKVWGYKPVYGPDSDAKRILYESTARTVVQAGNIYAYRNYIFQVEPGRGIHVIDNSVPSAAVRIGFINIKGCAQMSIKGDKLYSNSYDDLVVLDFSALNDIKEVSRLPGVFLEYRWPNHRVPDSINAPWPIAWWLGG